MATPGSLSALITPEAVAVAVAAGATSRRAIVHAIVGDRHGTYWNRLVDAAAAAAGITITQSPYDRTRTTTPKAPKRLGPPRWERTFAATVPLPSKGYLADHVAVATAIDGAPSIGEICRRLGYEAVDSKTIRSLKAVAVHLGMTLPDNDTAARFPSVMTDMAVTATAPRATTAVDALHALGLAGSGTTADKLRDRCDDLDIDPAW